MREAPSCVQVGAFAVRGRAGVNQVAFAGRIRGKRLRPGTYALVATALRRERAVPLGRTRVVVVEPGSDARRVRPAASTCGSGLARLGASAAPGGPTEQVELARLAGVDSSRSGAAAGGAAASEGSGAGEDGVPSESAVAGVEASGPASLAPSGAGGTGPSAATAPSVLESALEGVPGWLQALLLAALAGSILLLTAAAAPAAAVRPAGAAPVIDRRRTELALAGAIVLAAVTVVALVV